MISIVARGSGSCHAAGVRAWLLLPVVILLSACDSSSEPARTPSEPEAPARPAETAEGPARPEPEGPPNPLGLPDELSAALRAEMIGVEAAMAELQSQLARGRREEAARTAMRIHDSFILKQELSEEQLRALVSALPEEFLHRDRAFHQAAAQVAHAAESGDLAEAARGYGEMTSACVGCHAAHAATRFPGLAGVQVAPPEPPAEGEPAEHAH